MHKHIHEQMRRDHGHLVAKPPRSPMNEFAKFIVNQSNFIFTCLGLIMMAIAFYSFFADFGEIDRGYFLGFGLCCFLFGLIVVYVLTFLSLYLSISLSLCGMIIISVIEWCIRESWPSSII